MGNRSKILKVVLGSLIIIVICAVLWVVFSPYRHQAGHECRMIIQTIEIEATVAQVYGYMGNSDHASEWSTFVSHIVPLNEGEVPDGEVGSERRCFRYADETGTQWDEIITENVINTKRQLRIFNMVDFPMTAENLVTEQLYEDLHENRCKLSLILFFENCQPTFWDLCKMYLASYRINSIFRDNLHNIKNEVEIL